MAPPMGLTNMGLTKRQLAKRQEHKNVGASQVPAICGLSPYSPNAYELWMEFTDKLDPRPATPAMAAGNALEDAVLDWYAADAGVHITRAGSERRVPDSPILTHRDATVTGSDEPIEAKTTGVYGPAYGCWGAEQTDEIPHHYLVQCLTHLAASKADVCHVPVLLCGSGFRVYRVQRDRIAIEWILATVAAWWECVQKDTPPPQNGRPVRLETWKRMRREPGKSVQVDPDLVQEYRRSQLCRLNAQELEDDAKRDLLAAGGSAEQFDGDHQGSVTYLPYTQESFDSKRFRSTHPDLAKEFTRTTTYRRLAYREPT